MPEGNTLFVLYHAQCADGFGAAWVAWKAYGDQATYLPVQYGQPVPKLPDGAVVYILDFSYPLPDLRALADRMIRLAVIDHHATAGVTLNRFAAEMIPGETYLESPGGSTRAYSGRSRAEIVFDLDHSGAVLSWRYFMSPRDPVPRLLEYVQDRDLWRWALPDSKEVSAVIRSWPFDFKRWTILADTLSRSEGMEATVREGRAILRAQAQAVEAHVRNAVLQPLAGKMEYLVPTVNATVLMSEIGHTLCEQFPDAPFSATYFYRADGKRVWSLRSIGDYDVGAVAKSLGGGGHRNAAGFEETP